MDLQKNIPRQFNGPKFTKKCNMAKIIFPGPKTPRNDDVPEYILYTW